MWVLCFKIKQITNIFIEFLLGVASNGHMTLV